MCVDYWMSSVWGLYLLSSHQLQMRSYRDACTTLFSILSVSLKNTKPPFRSISSLEIGMIQHCSKVGYRLIGDGRSLQCMLVKKHPFIPFHPSTLWLIVVCMPIASLQQQNFSDMSDCRCRKKKTGSSLHTTSIFTSKWLYIYI